MATSMKMLRVGHLASVNMKMGPCRLFRFSKNIRQLCSVSSEVKISDGVDYPEIKPRYPPGAWQEMTEKRAWKQYEMAMELNKIDEVKFRLEKIAGEEKKLLWNASPITLCPHVLKYFQYITKTHIATGFPEHISEMDVSNDIESIQPLVIDALLQESYYQKRKIEAANLNSQHELKVKSSHRMVGKMLESILSMISLDKRHLLSSQFDESVKLETIWRRCGYGELESIPKGAVTGTLTFQFKHEADFQIRTELPLPQFLPVDHDMCLNGEYPMDYNYGPYAFGQSHSFGRPFTVSGHWVGDPCNFTHTSLHTMKDLFYSIQEEFGNDSSIIKEKFIECGLLTAFGSCVAQAHNLGFNQHWDVTYPITTQTVVTDGKQFQVFAYQLNTLHLWRADESNPLRNVLWSSPLMNLYDSDNNGELKDFNSDVLSYLIKFLSNTPVDRGVELRPYLPNEEDPVNKTSYINDLGTEPPPPQKAERWLYPKYSLYF